MASLLALVASCPMTLVLGSILGLLLIFSALVSSGKRSPVVRKQPGVAGHGAQIGACVVKAEGALVVPPGPKPLPIIGSLHLLGKYAIPYEGFVALKQIYGDLFKMKLGARNCIVVNTLDHMKEVLVTKGGSFGGRPDFMRYHILFGGDRDNSLALCDWSSLQKTRRSIVHSFIYPKKFSDMHSKLGEIIVNEIDWLIERLSKSSTKEQPVEVKDLILAVCCNIFTMHFCSKRFDLDDQGFQEMISLFDSIFYDINQGYAVDFIPWLSVFHLNHFKTLRGWSKRIREIILREIVSEHESSLDVDDPRDFVDVLLTHLMGDANGNHGIKKMADKAKTMEVLEDPSQEEQTPMDYQAALYELEDLIGGHSAIGNLFMRMAVFLERDPEIIAKVREEVDAAVAKTGKPVTIDDRHLLPYTEAVMLETLRIISSPIVPHVATENTSIENFFIEKGSVVFLNNYELNTSSKYWENPEIFNPARFVKDGRISKPEYFIPFSTGRRACMGHKIVQNVTFLLTAKLFSEFDIRRPHGDNRIETMQPACLAVPPKAFQLIFTPRSSSSSHSLPN